MEPHASDDEVTRQMAMEVRARILATNTTGVVHASAGADAIATVLPPVLPVPSPYPSAVDERSTPSPQISDMDLTDDVSSLVAPGHTASVVTAASATYYAAPSSAPFLFPATMPVLADQPIGQASPVPTVDSVSSSPAAVRRPRKPVLDVTRQGLWPDRLPLASATTTSTMRTSTDSTTTSSKSTPVPYTSPLPLSAVPAVPNLFG